MIVALWTLCTNPCNLPELDEDRERLLSLELLSFCYKLSIYNKVLNQEIKITLGNSL